MSTTLLSCDANGTFLEVGGITPSGIGIVAMKAESEAADTLKVHGLEVRGAKRPVYLLCAALSWKLGRH